MTEPRTTNPAVPPLVGGLPPQCRRDVDTLRRFVHSTVAREAPAEAVSPNDFREVLLTGATGFVGRYCLRELLRQNERLTVHCLVRAESAEHGIERIRDSLEQAEIWEDEFAPRLRVVPGDICTDRFGLSESVFEGLSRRIDAVYHLAAEVRLILSYAEIREVNALGLRAVLQLCLRTRYKHLFYISTMGIFPEYFCNFGGEFSRNRIDDQMQPDLAGMKKTFPLGAIGYPWSKLVAEQGVLFAKAAGAPTAVLRLPQMELSSTGDTRASDFRVRLFAAATQVGKAPQNFSMQGNSEPVDTVSEICVAISLNPDRRFTIYHLCNPQPPYADFEVADFGFYWETVSYQAFRRACQAVGENSPMYGQWVLVDHFAPYWFSESKTGRTLPVSDGAIREDCPRPIKWPNMLIGHARSYDWIRRHQDRWPFPVPRGRLDFDCLIGQARVYAERMGVPFERTYPAWMRAGLEQLVQALQSPEAGLRKRRLSHVIYGLTRTLRNNAALVRERQMHPEIARQQIARPVFIVGINRTGTTFLHRLLSRDRRFWALRRYELTEPVLASGQYATAVGTPDDPRPAYVEELMRGAGVVDRLDGIHRIDVEEPEEDFMVLRLAFATWVITVAHHVPAYGRWLAETGSRHAYAHHRQVMQNFTWQRRQREPGARRQWLQKMPFHLMELEVLLETYPDAVFIQTHREPTQFMASWNSLVERIRSFTMEPRPRPDAGAEQLSIMSGMLNNAMRFRESRPELDQRWVDVNYVDLVENPMAVVRHIYERLGWRLEPEVRDEMEDWLSLQAEHRRGEPPHRYRLEDFGLTPQRVDDAFAPYRDFISSRGIREAHL